MIKRQLLAFIARWAFSTVGMWISISLLATTKGNLNVFTFIFAGFIFSLLNAFVRPIATTLTLPLILLTMGLFTVIINTAMVALTLNFLPDVSMTFWNTILSSLILSIANGVVNYWSSPYNRK